jgi:hypothetical protein
VNKNNKKIMPFVIPELVIYIHERPTGDWFECSTENILVSGADDNVLSKRAHGLINSLIPSWKMCQGGVYVDFRGTCATRVRVEYPNSKVAGEMADIRSENMTHRPPELNMFCVERKLPSRVMHEMSMTRAPGGSRRGLRLNEDTYIDKRGQLYNTSWLGNSLPVRGYWQRKGRSRHDFFHKPEETLFISPMDVPAKNILKLTVLPGVCTVVIIGMPEYDADEVLMFISKYPRLGVVLWETHWGCPFSRQFVHAALTNFPSVNRLFVMDNDMNDFFKAVTVKGHGRGPVTTVVKVVNIQWSASQLHRCSLLRPGHTTANRLSLLLPGVDNPTNMYPSFFKSCLLLRKFEPENTVTKLNELNDAVAKLSDMQLLAMVSHDSVRTVVVPVRDATGLGTINDVLELKVSPEVCEALINLEDRVVSCKHDLQETLARNRSTAATCIQWLASLDSVGETCGICLTNPLDTIIRSCGHMTCLSCCKRCERCVQCRGPTSDVVYVSHEEEDDTLDHVPSFIDQIMIVKPDLILVPDKHVYRVLSCFLPFVVTVLDARALCSQDYSTIVGINCSEAVQKHFRIKYIFNV